MKILITAGPTREPIDPVRFISNRSSGRMGYALAEAARDLGHEVFLISGPVTLKRPSGLTAFIAVTTAAEMYDATMAYFPDADLTIMTAAVADYTPAHVASQKIKKSNQDVTLTLVRTRDILATLSTLKQPHQILVGFAAETENLFAYAKAKLHAKNLDFIAANDVHNPESGFGVEQNAVTLFARNGTVTDFPLQPKTELAIELIRKIIDSAPDVMQ